ncbi:hypothetical protein KHA80_08530 [Anaerobacillus sp. HL2]|nr:hypothetical protein KHA80_08530 [Anaerobacillus sp. HL2]
MESTLDKSLNVSLLINELKQDNNEMQSVMKKIQDISRKSNILALNSGIEAARAEGWARLFGCCNRDKKVCGRELSMQVRGKRNAYKSNSK